MQDSRKPSISQKTKDLIEKLLLGKFSRAEIAKVTGLSEYQVEMYLNSKYEFLIS